MGVQLDSGGGKKGGITPNINVTPLVDVVLVLLIIFMVVLPDMQEGKPISMVKVERADKPIDAEPVIVTIDAAEVYTLNEDDTSRAAVLEALKQNYQRNTLQPIVLRADAGLPYRVVRDFFAEVQQIGFQNISLAVGVAREWSEGEGA